MNHRFTVEADGRSWRARYENADGRNVTTYWRTFREALDNGAEISHYYLDRAGAKASGRA